MQPYLFVFVYKDGLLARLAHDLRLRVERFQVELEEGRVEARLDLASLRVDGVMRRGALVTDGLSQRDREEILERARDVLHVDRFPEASLVAELQPGPAPSLLGRLQLAGREETVTLQVVGPEGGEDAHMQVRGRLTPSRWGIEPFRALGGALRLQDRVDIEAGVSWQGLPRMAPEWLQARGSWSAEGATDVGLSPVDAQK